MSNINKILSHAKKYCSNDVYKLIKNILISESKKDSIRLECYLSEGEILKPLRSFKMYIDGTLQYYDKRNCFLIYKIHSNYEDYNLPLFCTDEFPSLLMIHFNHEDSLRLVRNFDEIVNNVEKDYDLMKLIVPIAKIDQLLQITTNCETIGRIDITHW